MRRRGLRLANYRITNHQSPIRQRGYMLITLMLAMALIAIALLAVLPSVKQQIIRDREDEMRHRGTAYMRAIQHFYKKFGRYPSRVEELEDTNNMRFIRKRYTDPLTHDPVSGKEKDFKFLHQQDISLNSGIVLPGQTPGLSGIPGQNGAQGQTGVQGQIQAGLAALSSQTGGVQPTLTQNASGNDAETTDPNSPGGAGGANPSSSPFSSSSSSSSSNSGSGFNGPTFGGGPILGVSSTSKAKSIRIFNDKNHYNDWLFVYIPQADRGGLLVGPVSTNGPTAGFGGGLTPGQTGLPGQGTSQGFGQGLGQGFGQGSSTNGPGQTTSPPQPPPQ
jgi:type II secretory pathway pseudopilin PulG